ncbi:Armadillo-like helical [Metarhizium guizhouense ARSEF 977]|uniref:Armadillo-like helical n=1 Tax=Metarhizium guizhouense (strain ARSEF 977) TaxID=1276136 RepID=A0A0B4GZB7_METGA|nr:Armadillo-like helical [Metarhizium guizhouense ARSEF 977]
MLKSNFKEWKKVVRQLAAYADEHRVRYGFIVTDKLVVVLRFSRKREVAARGVGANLPIRSTRAPTPQVSSESDIPSSQSFEDDDRGQDLGVEYKAIPWSTHGRGRLTAKLALVALAMMSLHGDNYIASSYPKINTWRGGPNGIRHNTSAEFRKMAARGLVMDEPKSKEPEGEDFEEEDEEDDEEDDEDDDEEDDEDDDEDDDETMTRKTTRR